MREASVRVMTDVRGESREVAGRNAEPVDSQILACLRERMGVEDFDRFIAADARLRIEPGRIVVGVPTRFMAEVLRQRFRGALEDVARGTTDAPGDVQVEIEVEPRRRDRRDETREAWKPSATWDGVRQVSSSSRRNGTAADAPTGFALKHRLDDFVEGESNKAALTVATIVADPRRSDACSPFVVHGPCGVGKTHLLQGIALRWMEVVPGTRVKYTTAEAFTNDFMEAIRTNRRDEFRKRHRGVKLLCIDDVHYLSNKRGTQSEFLHTLDAIDLRGARVVVASDAHPTQIDKISTALASRLVSGAVIAIAPPDEALRREIVRRLALRRGLMLTDEAIEFLVSRSVGIAGAASVRELEGLVLRVQAMRQFLPEADSGVVGVCGVRIALGVVGDGLSLRRPQRPVPVRVIESHVCRTLGVSSETLRGRGRSRQVVLARWIIAFLSYRLANSSYPDIAREMGRPNHSSVITACRSLEKLLEGDPLITCGDTTIPLRRVIDEVADRACRESGRM